MALLINSPPTTAVDALEARGRGVFVLAGVLDGWRNWFNSVYAICNAVSMSGPTSERPSKDIYVGRVYFDTTLGQPIWALSITAGSVNWVDATGAPA